MNAKSATTIVSAIVIIWVGYLVLTGFVLKWDFGGEFGDTFGALNALFSGLAMGGVIVAIFMQRQELILQREELRLTREELTRSAEAQEGQTQALIRQYEILRTTAEINAYTGLRDIWGPEAEDQVRRLLKGLEGGPQAS